MPDANYIFQNALYVGNNFNAILYGVELTLYFASVKLIMDGHERRKSTRGDKTFLLLSTGLLCMITIYLIVQNFFGEEMWVIHDCYPGGDAQYFAENAAVWYQTFGSAASIVLCLMSDALLIHRTYVVWGDWRVIVFPSLLYIGTLALGIMTLYFSGRPNADFFVGTAVHVALSYSTVGIALNVTCSALICFRIISLSRRIKTTLGEEASRMYTGAASVIIESMLPYTIFGVAYVATLGANSPVSISFLSLYVMFTCISPQMIIIRVLMGRGWSQDAMSTLSAAQFRRPDTMETTAAHSHSVVSGYGNDTTAINLSTLAASDLSKSRESGMNAADMQV